MSNIPITGKQYVTFQDGKLKPSRRYIVVIDEVTPFDKIDEKTLEQWQTEVKNCPWLYNITTDYLIKGTLEEGTKVTYVRTVAQEWFDLDNEAGRLDLGGSLDKLYTK